MTMLGTLFVVGLIGLLVAPDRSVLSYAGAMLALASFLAIPLGAAMGYIIL